MDTVLKAGKRMEWLVSFLVVRYKFIYQTLSLCRKHPMPGMGTIGVTVKDSKFFLYYDPEFILNISDEHATYILYHECLHLLLHHCTSRSFRDKETGNIAHDAAINELIPVQTGSCERPEEGVFVDELRKESRFRDIKNLQSSEWYYEYFLRKKEKSEGSKPQLSDNHDGWNEDEIADEKIRNKVKEIERNNHWGSCPGTVQEIIRTAQIRKIDWKSFIRQFAGNIMWKDMQATRKKPNRRMGYLFPGSRKKFLDKGLVCIDTSGSMNEELLSLSLSVVNSMLDFFPIDMMQFDTQKCKGPEPFDRKRISYEFQGRGGTDFTPAIETCNENRYKFCIIITDGEAGAVDPPENTEVLWVLPKGHHPPVEWGRKIHMTKY